MSEKLVLDPQAIILANPTRVGRPTDMTPSLVTKLIAAFNNGFNVVEACQYGGISKQTYYRWLKEDSEFSDLMEHAKMAPNRKAKEIVVQAINGGDAQLAFRYLQARDPDFKPKFEGELAHGLQETREKIKDFLDDGTDLDQTGTDVSGTEHSATPADSGSGEVAQTPPDIS